MELNNVWVLPLFELLHDVDLVLKHLLVFFLHVSSAHHLDRSVILVRVLLVMDIFFPDALPCFTESSSSQQFHDPVMVSHFANVLAGRAFHIVDLKFALKLLFNLLLGLLHLVKL